MLFIIVEFNIKSSAQGVAPEQGWEGTEAGCCFTEQIL